MDRKRAIKRFFTIMEQSDTVARNSHLSYLKSAMLNFADSEVEYNANMVYDIFTEMNRFQDTRGKPLRNLMDTMKTYEKKASTLTESQRDHFVHSVNVFLLGVQIYTGSSRFREAFASSDHSNLLGNVHERFIYIWGNTALFHDIGYPIEIAANQAKAFSRTIERIGSKPDSRRTDVGVDVYGFDSISNVPASAWVGDGGQLDLIDALSRRMSERIGVGYEDVHRVVGGYIGIMHDGRFVDHGFYSAMILLRSMAVSMQSAGMGRESFDTEMVDAASAILLHNMYRGVFTSDRYDFGCPPMRVLQFPVAYLLILCDELQDWNRKKYGVRTKKSVYPDNSRAVVDGTEFTINYFTEDEAMAPSFVDEKQELLHKLLCISDLFDSFKITCSSERSADILLESIDDHVGEAYPRPIMDNLEALAMEIHRDYNDKRRKEKPGEPLEYPTWEGLPQDLKYSNMMQAISIPDKLAAIGCHIGTESEGTAVESFNDGEILKMAMMEHDRWVAERESNGWVYGPQKDVDRRISPYIAPWEEIPEEIQRYDVETVENIIPLLKRLGLKVLRDE